MSKPGAMAVGLINAAPATSKYAMTAYTIEGRPSDRWKSEFVIFSVIFGDYFRVWAFGNWRGVTSTQTIAPILNLL